IMPDGGQVFCPRDPANLTQYGANDYVHALFVCNTNPDLTWFGTNITWDATLNGWDVLRKDGTLFTFPSDHLLSSITDRNNNQVTLTRNASDDLTKITGPNGRYINLFYDAINPHQVDKATDSTGRFVLYTYDSNNRMTSVTDVRGKQTTFSWLTGTKMGDIGGATFPNGSLPINATATYDTSNHLTSLDGFWGTYNFAYQTQTGQGIVAVNISALNHSDGTTLPVHRLEYNVDDYVKNDILAYD